ncbi:MAG TPA: hypothetical protein VFT57_15805 [Gemmatimonadaceae bacterium]|nr:hypothetical protein [Gemmatimonadaceae bacterium]
MPTDTQRAPTLSQCIEREREAEDALVRESVRGERIHIRPAEDELAEARAATDEAVRAVEAGAEVIRVKRSPTADTRTCDYANVSKETLYASSEQHIEDVRKALRFFAARLAKAGENHDPDKLTDIDGFHADFVTGFAQTGWWERHRKLNRHHLTMEDGIPADVNLIDVLDFIADCVMAGMARSGSVYALHLPPELLERSFQNTVEMLKAQVVVDDATPAPTAQGESTGGDHGE